MCYTGAGNEVLWTRETHSVVFKMTKRMQEQLTDYPTIQNYLASVPEDLWDLVLPESPSQLGLLARAIHELRAREAQREYIIGLQKKYELPLRPNATMHETMKLVRLERKKRQSQRNKGITFDRDGNPPIDPDELLM